MRIVNRREPRKADVASVLQQAQLAPDLKALHKVHGGPPAVLTGGKRRAGQHRVIGTNPSAQQHLQNHKPTCHDQTAAQRVRDICWRLALGTVHMAYGLNAQQRQQHQATDQVECDDGGEQLHSHG